MKKFSKKIVLVAGALFAGVQARAIDVAFLKELIAIPSETRNVTECNRATAALEKWLTSRHVFVAPIETGDKRRFLYAATTPGLEHDYVFVTHIDVVPAIEKSQYLPRIEGDVIIGRGACDTKGNAVLIAQVLANLVGKASVGAVFSTDEEGGSSWKYTTAEYAVICGVKPRKMVLVGDSAGEVPGQLFIAEKGHLCITLTAYGKGGHSSIPWTCDNPIPKLFAAYGKILEAFPCHATAEDNWHDALSATCLEGSHAGNIIPDKATMKLSYRYITPGDDVKMVEKLRKLTGLEVKVPPKHLKPVTNRADDPKIAALLKAMRAKWPKRNIRTAKMSAATDAWHFAHFQLPTVIFAADAHGAHAVDESGSLSSLHEYAEMFTAFILSDQEPLAGLGLPDMFVAAARKAYQLPEYATYTNSFVTMPLFRKWQGRADLPARGVVRWIEVGGTVNFRDIGGWNGLKTGLVFRGAEPNCQPREKVKYFHDLNLTSEGKKVLSETLGIKTDLDLRGRAESPTPDISPIPGAKLVRIPCAAYTNFLQNTKVAADLLRVFANPANYPIYFHCYGGADRTGSLAFLLEGLCGAREEDLCIDYELTSFSRIGRRPRFDKSYFYAAMVRKINAWPGDTFQAKIESYVREACGLTDTEIAAIRRMIAAEK